MAAVERNAGGRRSREGGVREPRQSRSRSGVAVMHEFFLICDDRRGAERADRNDNFWTSGPPTGASARRQMSDSRHFINVKAETVFSRLSKGKTCFFFFFQIRKCM